MKFPRREFLRLGAAALAAPPFSDGVRAGIRLADARGAAHRRLPAGRRRRRGRRIAAARLSEIWGQQVIVENKGGAGGECP